MHISGKIMTANPFKIVRQADDSLTTQLADGLRQAILTGFYPVGKALPARERLARQYGVSQIVVRAAIRRLSAEGLVVSRPRIGCMVQPRNVRIWKGQVLLVLADVPGSYYLNVFADELQNALMQDGWALSRVSVRRGYSGRYDFAAMDLALSGAVSLVVLMYNNDPIERHLEKCGTPFVVIGKRRNRKASGFVHFNREAAVPEFVRNCTVRGIRRVLVAGCTEKDTDVAGMLQEAGIACEEWVIEPLAGLRPPEAMERAALKAFERRFSGTFGLPDLIFFSDDFVAQGALTALLAAGVRIPDDVKVVSWANAGLGPVFPRTLTRMEMDAVANGRSVAGFLSGYFKGGRLPDRASVSSVYIIGDTFV